MTNVFSSQGSQSQSYFTTGGLRPISSSWGQTPLTLATSNFIFQLNTCGYSPYVTSSLTTGLVSHLQFTAPEPAADSPDIDWTRTQQRTPHPTVLLLLSSCLLLRSREFNAVENCLESHSLATAVFPSTNIPAFRGHVTLLLSLLLQLSSISTSSSYSSGLLFLCENLGSQ
jgi:hypothetical protein